MGDLEKVIFRGVGTAIITPMKENGEINYPVFKKLLDRQADGGADAVVVAGTTFSQCSVSTTRWRISPLWKSMSMPHGTERPFSIPGHTR